METVFVLEFSENEFTGSGFALWRHLWRRPLHREYYAMEEVAASLIQIPLRADEVSYMGARSRRLLYRRLEQAIAPGALCLCRERGIFPEFIGVPDGRLVKELGAYYLPAICAAIQRQWGKLSLGTSAAVVSRSGDFISVARALAPFVRSMDVVTDGVPDFGGQDYAWEEWGLTVCFRQEVPEESPLVILWDAEDMEVTLPEGAFTINLSETDEGDSTPENIFFHVPEKIAPVSRALGGMTLSSLAFFAEQFCEEENAGERLSKCGFSVSRVERRRAKKQEK